MSPMDVTLHVLWRLFLHFIWRSDEHYERIPGAKNIAEKSLFSAKVDEHTNNITRDDLWQNGNLTVRFRQS